MSYEEKNVVVSLSAGVAILGYYLVRWLGMLGNGELQAGKLFALWGVVLVASVVVRVAGYILTAIALHVVHAAQTGSTDEVRLVEDERDRLISLKGTRSEHYTFGVGAFLAMLAFALGQPVLLMFGLLIFFSLAADIVGSISKLYLYRRGG